MPVPIPQSSANFILLPYARHYKLWLVKILPHFDCGLYSKAANITDNLCTKQGNSLKKIRGL